MTRAVSSARACFSVGNRQSAHRREAIGRSAGGTLTGQNGFLARQCTTDKNTTRTDESSRNRGMVAKIFPAPAEVPDPAVGNDEKEKGTQSSVASEPDGGGKGPGTDVPKV